MFYYNALFPEGFIGLAFSGTLNEREESRWVVQKLDGTGRRLTDFLWLFSQAVISQLSELQCLGAALRSHMLGARGVQLQLSTIVQM